jgi:hypothetical protein
LKNQKILKKKIKKVQIQTMQVNSIKTGKTGVSVENARNGVKRELLS